MGGISKPRPRAVRMSVAILVGPVGSRDMETFTLPARQRSSGSSVIWSSVCSSASAVVSTFGQFRETGLQRAQYFDPLDGVDPQVGFHVHAGIKHFGGIAGLLADDFQEGLFDGFDFNARWTVGACTLPLHGLASCAGSRSRDGNLRCRCGSHHVVHNLSQGAHFGKDGCIRLGQFPGSAPAWRPGFQPA